MSVYIKGRKPPNSCDDCWVSDCPNDEHIDGYRMMGRPTYCPLIPVPDHGDLIDRNELRYKAEICLETTDAFISMIAFAPTIIPTDKGGEA